MSVLQTTSTPRAFPASTVGGRGSDVLDATNLKTRAGKGAECGLRARAGRFGAVAAGGAHLDVHGGDTELLDLPRGRGVG